MRLRLRAASLTDAVSTLSGGNQQKVLLAKWLEVSPKVLIVDEPTRGVDIGAKEEIYHLLHELAAQGLSCIMISSEMNELIGLCHRIGVMRLGRLVAILDGQHATEEQIIHAAGLETAGA
jgi:ABC-type sugar transport system ATPase subunit